MIGRQTEDLNVSWAKKVVWQQLRVLINNPDQIDEIQVLL
jgi:hypothetical protein